MTDAALVEDPVRTRLLAAAVRIFAREGYAGTKVLDIVREAGLSTAAIYGRFRSKEDLLREAVVQSAQVSGHAVPEAPERVADLINRVASLRPEPLSDDEAVRLEAYVTARRDPQVAAALADAGRRRRAAVQPLVEAAFADGSVGPSVSPEAVLFFVQTMHLGMLLQRGAGVAGPDPASWDDLVGRIVASFVDQQAPPGKRPRERSRKLTT